MPHRNRGGTPVTDRLVLDDVADAVAAEGVTAVYGVLGDGNLHLGLALERAGVAWVSTRHEQEAVAMADGAARRTGALAVASVTHGPGLTNAMTALTAAALAGSPVLLLLGDTPRTTRHHGQDVPQEPFVRAAGAAWVPVRLPGDGVRGRGGRGADGPGRRQPVVLNLPVDLQSSPSVSGPPQPSPVVPRRGPGAGAGRGGPDRRGARRGAGAAGPRRAGRARRGGGPRRAWPRRPAPGWARRCSARGCSAAIPPTSASWAGSRRRRRGPHFRAWISWSRSARPSTASRPRTGGSARPRAGCRWSGTPPWSVTPSRRTRS